MSSINKIKLPNNTSVDIEDSRISDSDITSWNGKPDDSGVVHTTGNETVAGDKSFSDYVAINGSIGTSNDDDYPTGFGWIFDYNDVTLQSVLDQKLTSSSLSGYWNNTNSGTTSYDWSAKDLTSQSVSVMNSGGARVRIAGKAHNADAGEILFECHNTTPRNGFKIASKYSAVADRQDLVFYSSNNATSPYSAVWSESMRIAHDGAVSIPGSLTVNSNTVYHSGNFIAGTDYVSISETETISGKKTFTGAVFSIKYDNPRIGFYTSAGTLNGVIAYRDTIGPEIYTGSAWKRMYHSGNSNKSDVAWACSTLTTNGDVSVTGNITATGTITPGSDSRIKDNQKEISSECAFSVIENLKPKTWVWNEKADENLNGKSAAGLVAQEVKEILPDAVTISENGEIKDFHSLNYNTIQGYEIAAIKGLIEEVKSLKAEIAELKKQIK